MALMAGPAAWRAGVVILNGPTTPAPAMVAYGTVAVAGCKPLGAGRLRFSGGDPGLGEYAALLAAAAVSRASKVGCRALAA